MIAIRVSRETNITAEEYKSLFNSHFDELRNYVFYKSGDEELASDIVQDVFVKLWTKRTEIKKESVIGFLYKIANNLFISDYRHKKVKLKFKSNYLETNNPITPEGELFYNETKMKYEQTLEMLPEKQRLVFLMSRIDELSYKEIAERLNISVKAVEKRMSLALKVLRKQLQASN